jgi:hypothetical protein
MPASSRWNDGYGADSGRSRDDPYRRALRPTATYAAAICYVRCTSILLKNPVVAPALGILGRCQLGGGLKSTALIVVATAIRSRRPRGSSTQFALTGRLESTDIPNGEGGESNDKKQFTPWDKHFWGRLKLPDETIDVLGRPLEQQASLQRAGPGAGIPWIVVGGSQSRRRRQPAYKARVGPHAGWRHQEQGLLFREIRLDRAAPPLASTVS